MVTIGARLVGTVISNIVLAGYGALVGYVYAKLADLPAGPSAKAWAVLLVAENAMVQLATAITEHRDARAILRITAIVVTGTYGIQEMRKRGLMGDKMMYFIIGLKALAILRCLAEGMVEEQPAT